jgi:hypothetical protein
MTKTWADPVAIGEHISKVVPLAPIQPRMREPGEDDGDHLGVEPPPANDAEIPPHLLDVPGLVGKIANWITDTALYPQPLLSLGAALGLVGLAAGRKYAGPTKSGTHLYILGLAGTGAGKNHPAKMSKRLLRAAKMDDLIGPGQFASETAIYDMLAAQKQRLCFMDEFGSYLRKINNSRGNGHEQAISGALRVAWGASFDTMSPPAYSKGSNRDIQPIVSPALSIYGMSVHEEFYAGLQTADVANGFLNRFLILSTHCKPEEVDPALDEDEQPAALIDGLQHIAARPADLALARRMDEGIAAHRLDWDCREAREMYQTFRKGIIEGRDDADAKLLSRVPEMAVRLATIRAVGARKIPMPQVSLADITWGCELAMWSANRLIAEANSYMAESEYQSRAQEVLRYLKEAPRKTLKKSDLSRKIKHRYKARELNEILDGLTEADQVVVTRTKTDGADKPTDFIRYIGG